ncbi:DUF2848 family protein [Metabacillus idriensis]|uniref:DUF2848 family protein n=1 Tax=Metabacillus idriensis TaxID=324768 RepID=UPI00174DDD43|nr:DUF2848 family protein [Metabacillus idriensis]
MNKFEIKVHDSNTNSINKTIDIEHVLIVGYGGRQMEKIREHIRELEAIGVAPPVTIPELYPQKIDVLTSDSHMKVKGKETSGEVEYVLFHDGQEWLVTVGSDHTDRHIETISVIESKSACPKPFSTEFWRLRDLEQHWDQLILRSWSTVGNDRKQYQEHDLTALLPVSVLLSKLKEFGYDDLSQTIIFTGTVPTLEGFEYGNHFEFELYDPILKRSINGNYSISVE